MCFSSSTPLSTDCYCYAFVHCPILVAREYLVIALIHIPCYAFFALVVKIKTLIFSTFFPRSLMGALRNRGADEEGMI
ncbi:hypothetical protein Scep_030384 [Stephania cephalantha]|uniref:Transmembrane protein n=1 Tax=Stephania cephalantha TaxID=152367 RepID=A0AAP0E2R4_9MAGN